MKTAVVIFMVFISGFLLAQSQYGEKFVYSEGIISFDSALPVDEETLFVGSPYYDDRFLTSQVSGLDYTLDLRYNANSGDMEFMLDNQLYALKKEVYPEVLMGSSRLKYIFTIYKKDKKFTNGFLLVIHESEKISVFKQERVKLLKAKNAVTSYHVSRPSTYKKIRPLYFVKYGLDIVELPRNPKKASKLFGEHRKEVLNFIRKNKLKLKKEKDVLKLAEFVETL